MIRLLFILSFLFSCTALANECDDDLKLTNSEKIACNNYYLMTGRWTLEYEKQTDTCKNFIKVLPPDTENIQLSNMFGYFWLARVYRSTLKLKANPDTYLDSNWQKLSGSKILWKEWYQANGFPTKIFSEYRFPAQKCTHSLCFKEIQSDISYNFKRDRLSGKLVNKFYAGNRSLCKVSFKITGKRRIKSN